MSCKTQKSGVSDKRTKNNCSTQNKSLPLQRKNIKIIRHEFTKSMFRGGIKITFMDSLIGRTKEVDEVLSPEISTSHQSTFRALISQDCHTSDTHHYLWS